MSQPSIFDVEPTFEAVDRPTRDKLAIVADPEHPVGRDAVAAFLAACEADARGHGGLVSVNRVRAALVGEQINPRRLSAFWSAFTGKGKPMAKTGGWITCKGSTSGNDGRPFAERRWVG